MATATFAQRRLGGKGRTPAHGFLRRLVGDQCGGSAIEFAFAAPLLLTVLMGSIEAAHLYLVQSELTAVARQAVRRLAVDAMAPEDAESYIRTRMQEITDAKISVSVNSVALDKTRSDLTVNVSVAMRDVMLFGFDSLIPETSTGSTSDGDGGSAALSAKRSSSMMMASADPGGADATAGTGTAAAPSSGPMLRASATMIKE